MTCMTSDIDGATQERPTWQLLFQRNKVDLADVSAHATHLPVASPIRHDLVKIARDPQPRTAGSVDHEGSFCTPEVPTNRQIT